jgi:uncharacterized membrane protein YeiH
VAYLHKLFVIYKMDSALIFTLFFYIGLIVESMTGAIAAGERRMDLFGVLVVASVTAYGGGVIRDLLLDRYPILFIGKPELLFVTSIAALFMVVIARYFRRLKWLFISLDALGMITFTLIGAVRALDMGHGMAVASLTGIITGVFGGILRDILCNRVPLAFQKELYATISIGSVWMFLLLIKFGTPKTVAAWSTLCVGFGFRMLAVRFDWHIPKFVYESGKNQ